ncbi:phosphatase PAP2 family protein [Bdellovibrio bacteriovorus]|uniref:phosphatase PAP2 family protein n=1 Tax=Bdellovibrio bacteriovorus TaxID=959 RepID=UPI0035A6F543
MLEKLDHALFHLINRTTANAGFDAFFPVWTDFFKSSIFYFLLPLLLFRIFYKERWKGLAVLLGAGVIASLADFLSGSFLKDVFERARPLNSNLLEEVILRGPAAGGFSFPSSHAADAFAVAAFVTSFYPRTASLLYPLAILMGYSRIYCGVHFPGDVIAGALLGLLLGKAFSVLIRFISKRARGV